MHFINTNKQVYNIKSLHMINLSIVILKDYINVTLIGFQCYSENRQKFLNLYTHLPSPVTSRSSSEGRICIRMAAPSIQIVQMGNFIGTVCCIGFFISLCSLLASERTNSDKIL